MSQENQTQEAEESTEESKEKNPLGFLVILAIVVIVLFIILSNSGRNDTSRERTVPTSAPSLSVRYEISGSGVDAVSLTWENDTGGTNQGDYKVPFKQSFSGFDHGDFVYISAQIIEPTSGAGSITCKIYQGSTVVAEASASGFPSIATCSGMLD